MTAPTLTEIIDGVIGIFSDPGIALFISASFIIGGAVRMATRLMRSMR